MHTNKGDWRVVYMDGLPHIYSGPECVCVLYGNPETREDDVLLIIEAFKNYEIKNSKCKDRHNLIDDLKNRMVYLDIWDEEKVADFIIKDRARIIKDLIKELKVIQQECSDKMTDLDEVDNKLRDLIDDIGG